MIDLGLIDSLFDQTKGEIRFGLLDKRVLLPLAQLAAAVEAETGEAIAEEELRNRAARGWYSPLGGGEGQGVPLYVPSRIGLFLHLERKGWSDEELRLASHREEYFIDGVWTQDDLAYLDDDVETVARYAADRVDDLAHRVPPASPEELSAARRKLASLKHLQREGVPTRLPESIKKAAFRVRAINDSLRVMMLDLDRAKLRAGYGPTVCTTSSSWNGSAGFRAERIGWRETIATTIAYAEEGYEVPIRIPEVLLVDDKVSPTRTLRPSEYARIWKENEFDTFFRTRAELLGEKRCLNCFDPLPETGPKRKFCKEACRNAAKQRRYRKEQPEAVERNAKRYWDSVDLGCDAEGRRPGSAEH